MPILTNIARADATFGQATLYDTSTVVVNIPAIKVDKASSAIDGLWIGDELTYTVTITNLDTETTATGLSFTDTIDPSLAILVPGSVAVGDRTLTEDEYNYNTTTGELNIPYGEYVMPEILPEGSYDVTFRVTKA